MWIRIDLNADPDPGSASASDADPNGEAKNLPEIKLTWKYQIPVV